MARRWGIKRNELFGYALAGAKAAKEQAFREMVNAEAGEVDAKSRAYLKVMNDYDAIEALLKAETATVNTKGTTIKRKA